MVALLRVSQRGVQELVDDPEREVTVEVRGDRADHAESDGPGRVGR